MKRFGYLFVLMAISSSAHAGSYSFAIGGHRITIAAPRHCLSPACVSISIPGVYSSRHLRYRDRDDTIIAASEPVPAKPPVEQAAAIPVAPPANKPAAQPVATPLPAPVVAPVASVVTTPPQVTAPVPAVAPPKPPIVAVTPPVAPPPVEIPTARVPPAAEAAPQILKVVHGKEDETEDSPLGDWQTEGKAGSVRIEPCGKGLCGYVLDAASGNIGESVLVNMKPKSAMVWSGDIYSRASGSTYYATMTLKGPNSLRVEACVLGQYFCSGNLWTRIAKPQDQISSRQVSPQPRT
jgi:uncharacterized protein (DUF2147 family)